MPPFLVLNRVTVLSIKQRSQECSLFFALSYTHLRTWSRDATVIGLKIQHNELMN